MFDWDLLVVIGITVVVFWPLWVLVIRQYEIHLRNTKE